MSKISEFYPTIQFCIYSVFQICYMSYFLMTNSKEKRMFLKFEMSIYARKKKEKKIKSHTMRKQL